MISSAPKEHQLMLKLMYSAGLTAKEAAGMKKSDIGWDLGIAGDRLFVIADSLKHELAMHLENVDYWLFDVTVAEVDAIVCSAAAKAGLVLGADALRKAYISHMIEAGYSRRFMDRLLNSRMPMLEKMKSVKSPADMYLRS